MSASVGVVQADASRSRIACLLLAHWRRDAAPELCPLPGEGNDDLYNRHEGAKASFSYRTFYVRLGRLRK